MKSLCLLLALLWPCAALAATPTHDATTSDNTGNNGQQNPTTSHTGGTGQSNYIALACITFQDTTGTLSSVTYGGQGMTRIGTDEGTATAASFASLWYLLAPPSGAQTVQANFSEAINDTIFSVSTYYNVNQSNPFGTEVADNGSGTTISVVVTSAAGELVVDCVDAHPSTDTYTAVGQTERSDIAISGNHWHGFSEEAGAASVTMSWTHASSNEWATKAIPLKPSSDRRAVAPMVLQ